MNWAVGPGLTATVAAATAMLLLFGSLTVNDCDPAVFNITRNVPTPLVSVPAVAGRQEVEIEHTLKDGDLAQVRFWLKAPAFHGELTFLGVELERIADPWE